MSLPTRSGSFFREAHPPVAIELQKQQNAGQVRSTRPVWYIALLIVGAGLGATAAGTSRIFIEAGELPGGLAWLDRLWTLLAPAAHGAVDASWWWGAGRSGGSIWEALVDLGLIHLNAQWDPDLWSLAVSVVHGVAVGTIVAFLIRHWSRLSGALAVAAIVCAAAVLQALAFAGREHALSGWFFLLFATTQAWMREGRTPRDRRWWLAWVLACCAALAAPLGVPMLAALAVGDGFRARARVHASDEAATWMASGVHGITCLAALAYWAALGRLDPTAPPDGFASWAGGWEALQLTGILVGIHILDTTFGPTGSAPRIRILAGLALILVSFASAANVCILSKKERATNPPPARSEAVRAWVREGRPEDLSAQFHLSPTQASEVQMRLDQPLVRQILPPSVRPSLGLEAAGDAAAGGFSSDGVPALEGTFSPPAARGTFGETRSARDALFLSTPIATSFPYLTFWICGAGVESGNALVLLTPDGERVEAFASRVDSPARWQRVNFRAPGGRFQVQASHVAGAEPFAFSSPVEVGALSRWAAKFVGIAPALVAVALLIWAGVMAAVVVLVGKVDASSSGQRLEVAAAMRRMMPWCLVATFALFSVPHINITAGGSDSSGYRNSARLLRSGILVPRDLRAPEMEKSDLTAQAYVPLGFRASGTQSMVPTYPVGLPLIYALFGTILGEDLGARAVVLLHLLAGVLATRGLARTVGLGDGLAWFAGAAVALSPLYTYIGLQVLSDVPAMVWVTLALWSACEARQKPGYAWLAGVATAVAVLVRPTNVLVVIPVVLAFGIRNGRALAIWALIGIPAAIWQGFYAWRLYGHPLASGYGTLSYLFAPVWLTRTLLSYLNWWPVLLTWGVALAGLFPFLRTVPGWKRLVLTVWVVLNAGTYAFYFCTHEAWWYQRFVLPSFPALIVMALAAARGVGEWLGLQPGVRWRDIAIVRGVAGLVVAVLLGQAIHLRVLYFVGDGHPHERACRWLAEHAPAGAVVVAGEVSGAVYFYTQDFLVRADGGERAAIVDALDRAMNGGRRVYAALTPEETARLALSAERWERAATFGNITVSRLRDTESVIPRNSAPPEAPPGNQ